MTISPGLRCITVVAALIFALGACSADDDQSGSSHRAPTDTEAALDVDHADGAEPATESASEAEVADPVWRTPQECPDLADLGDVNGHTVPDNTADPDDADSILSCSYSLDAAAITSVGAGRLGVDEAIATTGPALKDLGMSFDWAAAPELGAGAMRGTVHADMDELSGDQQAFIEQSCSLLVPTPEGAINVYVGADTREQSCDLAVKILEASQ